ncbi:enterobactin synthase subunit F [Klebsiella pneumoniae]|uniref:Enterobactin synthase subunit F n=1 Tax=Klebsiella pneumoniae TaxID=573 RepID=A0A377V1F8_KLEPN|nr:enterobactin synthase subunit F [Klebsiella pneumoniae]
MQADLAQDLRVDGGNPLVCHQLLRVGDDRWYWYQRYHHLLVDGFSFPAITRQIAAIYRAWQRGEATPESPFTPFAEVVDEYQRYAGSEAWQRDKAFWQAQRQALPAPASLSAAPLGGRAAGSDIWRMKLEMNADAFRRLASHAPQCQPADLALALTTLWLGRLCNRMGLRGGLYLYASDGFSRADLDRAGAQCPASGGAYLTPGRRWRTWRCASPLS